MIITTNQQNQQAITFSAQVSWIEDKYSKEPHLNVSCWKLLGNHCDWRTTRRQRIPMSRYLPSVVGDIRIEGEEEDKLLLL